MAISCRAKTQLFLEGRIHHKVLHVQVGHPVLFSCSVCAAMSSQLICMHSALCVL